MFLDRPSYIQRIHLVLSQQIPHKAGMEVGH
jgi:hypothetical protein